MGGAGVRTQVGIHWNTAGLMMQFHLLGRVRAHARGGEKRESGE